MGRYDCFVLGRLGKGKSANVWYVLVDYLNMQETAASTGTVDTSESGISNDWQQMPGHDSTSNVVEVREKKFLRP